ncbi:MAG TPA: hypothetical protein EYM50_01935 [Nitrososphaerales archaeon]|nr:hypothetical protein [Nitrososphaerales archaeon]
MKLKKRKISKVWKEVLETVEAFKDNPEYAPDPDHIQIYITTKDGGIVELHIGYDGEKILKTFDSFDSEEELEEQRIIERMEDPEGGILLN